MRLTALLVAAALTIPAMAHASDIIYTVDHTYGQLSVQGTITTDGTIGSLEYDNFLSYNLNVTNPDGSSLVSATSDDEVGVYNPENAITATTSGIFFNFSNSDPGFLLFFNTERTNYLCYQNNGCYDNSGGGVGAGYTNAYSDSQTGLQEIATASAATPEPESLSLVATGLLGLAGAVRRRSKR